MSFRDSISWLLDSWRTGMLGLALVVPSFAVYGVAEARSLRVTTDILTSASLPRELDGTRVVFVADIHAGPFFGPQRMDELVERVNELDADVLILGGDYVGGRMGGAKIFYPRAGGFRARAAKLAVLGNHDNWENPEDAKQQLEAAGFTVLENQSVDVPMGDSAIAVAGVDDLYTGTPDPEKAAREIEPDTFSILVSHNPDVFANRLGDTAGDWDLALAGHTHAGQVTFFGKLAYSASDHGNRYREGWRTENGTPILVTNGVGSVTLPVRVFARPEIHLITLRAE